MSYNSFVPPQSHQHQQPAYHDSAEYDAYSQSAPLPHPTYDSHPTPYRDEAVLPGTIPPSEPYKDEGAPSGTMADKEFDPFQPPPKSTGDLRMWRHDHHGNLWTKGGRGRCIGRFCCCTIMSIILVFASIVLTLAAFLRPPDIQLSGITASTSTNSVVATSTTLNANLGIVINVRNPNFFSVKLQSIRVNITYPINNTQIGGGEQTNIDFKSSTKTTFTFPFDFVYSQASDPQGKVLSDIVNKCGFVPGSAKQQLTIGYTLQLALKVLSVTVSPPFSGTTKFDCPFTLQDLQPLAANIPSLSSILSGSGGI